MIKINVEKCDMCGACVEACPVGKIIYLALADIGINKKKDCIGCMECIFVCQSDAITNQD